MRFWYPYDPSMKTLTQFTSNQLKNGIQKATEFTTAGKTAEELPVAMGEEFKMEGDKLKFFMHAIDVVKTRADGLKRVVVLNFAETEKIPSSYQKRDENHYLAEYYPSLEKPAKGRGGRFEGKGDGKRGKGRGGKGGRGDKRGGGGPGRNDRGRGPRGPGAPDGASPEAQAAAAGGEGGGDRRPRGRRRPPRELKPLGPPPPIPKPREDAPKPEQKPENT